MGAHHEGLRREEPEEPDAAHATARPRAGRRPSRTRTTTSCAPRSRRWPRSSAARSRCTPTRWTRRSRCRPSSPPASPATRSDHPGRDAHHQRRRPVAGSYLMESLTQEMADKAWAIIEEVEAMGGMTRAVDSGWAKLKIEASAARSRPASIRQGRDRRRQQVQAAKGRIRVEIPRSTTSRCATREIARLQQIKARATPRRVQAALAALTEAAKSGPTCWIWRSRRSARAPRSARSGCARGDLRPPPRRHPEGHRRLRGGLRFGRGLGEALGEIAAFGRDLTAAARA